MSNENLEKLNEIVSQNFAEEVLSVINENSKVKGENEEIVNEENYVLFDELKEKYESGQSIISILEIKHYLPIINKQILIEDIIDSSLELDESGMTKINYCSMELFFGVKLIEAMTNYAFDPETMIDEYDYIAEHGILYDITNQISNNEYNTIRGFLSKELEQKVKISNSIEGIINNHLYLFQDKIDTLISKIPNVSEASIDKWMKSASKTIKGFDPSKHEVLNKMMSFIKGEGK